MAILYFSKAFDTVPHKELLNKLHSWVIFKKMKTLCDIAKENDTSV
jgi:hypothetical protein